MNRREFIKTAIIGTLATSLPIAAIPSGSAGEWIGLSGVTQRLIRVGDMIQVRVNPTFTIRPIGGDMMQMVSPYKDFLVTEIDYEWERLKVVEG